MTHSDFARSYIQAIEKVLTSSVPIVTAVERPFFTKSAAAVYNIKMSLYPSLEDLEADKMIKVCLTLIQHIHIVYIQQIFNGISKNLGPDTGTLPAANATADTDGTTSTTTNKNTKMKQEPRQHTSRR